MPELNRKHVHVRQVKFGFGGGAQGYYNPKSENTYTFVCFQCLSFF